MQILTIDAASHEEAYGILCQRLELGAGVPSPFGATHCVVPPGGATAPHRHGEREAFYVTEGEGMIRVGEDRRPLRAGQVVLLPPDTEHRLENAADDAPLHFLSLYWFGAEAPPARPDHALVSAAPPTPNGPLHLGHVSGPYVAADVHTRYLRARGVDALYLCGSDDYQSYVATRAARDGVSPAAVTARFGDRNHASLRALGCDVARFLRPAADPGYREYVARFFTELVARGGVEPRETDHLHCPGCDRYIHEARVAGTCPRCGAGTCGNGCEGCAYVNDCADLLDPRCTTCGAPPARRRSTRFYLDLAAHAPAIEAWLAGADLSPRVRRLADAELARGLPAICVSHFDTWGIPVPGHPGQVIYEWLEMAAGYRYAADGFAAGDAGGADPVAAFAHPRATATQFFGFDNAFFYTFFIPAALLAHDPEVRLPGALLTNEFYRLTGEKFSTSRDHAVWCDDALRDYPADALRVYLAHQRPEFTETNFVPADLARFVGAELAAGIEAPVAALADTLAATHPDGLPETPGPGPAGAALLRRLGRVFREVGDALETRDFSLRRAARRLLGAAADLRDAADAGVPPPDLAAGWVAWAGAAAPLIPASAAAILAALGAGPDAPWPDEVPPLPAGTRPRGAPDLGFVAAARAAAPDGAPAPPRPGAPAADPAAPDAAPAP